MTTVIKMIYAVAEEQLSEMKDKANALNPQAEAPITGNVLEVSGKLNTLSKEIELLLSNYQTLLLTNIQSTKSSVQYMKEQDIKTSATITNALLNKPYMTYS